MILEIDHHSGVPIYRQVIVQIRQQIMTGGLAHEDQLETVRDLAGRLTIHCGGPFDWRNCSLHQLFAHHYDTVDDYGHARQRFGGG